MASDGGGPENTGGPQPTAFAVVDEFWSNMYSQLALHPSQRDMAVFDSQFTDQRVGGVRDSFSLDAASGYITAGGEFGVSDRGVDSDDGRHAVVTECRKKVFQWVELPATEPYTLDASMRYRYELVMSARGWIISEYTATGEC